VNAALRYLALAGPTAAGKTAAALTIAREQEVEIISVDSALVYRGMDIGTAKPNRAELAAVPHHLINIRDPLQPYSAAEFVTAARALIGDIAARGKLPLLVGGTMLYFKALLDGIDAMPKADAGVRAVIEMEALEKGWSALHAELALVDPVTAARLNPADSQRIARALEVFRLSGQPLSSFHTRQPALTDIELASSSLRLPRRCHPLHQTAPVVIASEARQSMATALAPQHGSPRRCTPRDDGSRYVCDCAPELVARNDDRKGADQSLLISLEPQDRAWLHQRIAERFDAMLATGFIDEVKALRARGDLHADLPSMRCVGYRQAWEYLDAHEARGVDAHGARQLDDRSALADLRNKGIFATRQLAKRQLTWLRSMPQRRVVACDAPDAIDKVLALAQSFVQDTSLPADAR